VKDKLRDLRTLTPLATLEPLYDLAALVPADEAIIELGTYRGASACWLAAGAQSGLGAHVWTIDPHDLPGYRTTTGRGRGGLDFTDPAIRLDAERQIREVGLAEHVTMIRDFSVEAGQTWAGPKVGLLFIDGDHRQDAVRKDFAAWEKHLSPDAVIAFDDHNESHPGVPAAVQALVDKGIISEPALFDRLAVCGFIPWRERQVAL
jgi:predicted O-methyltransferase YrrM